ncbi:unnamed protein product [Arabis nemorensis]|uniref:Uncharacterized protein n=1 Tax=Arabis nemorensis TaxID=586526 RepID=A0A565BPQ0_9BRAS|nr:unnamed protein product [Arabis nemorensis]
MEGLVEEEEENINDDLDSFLVGLVEEEENINEEEEDLDLFLMCITLGLDEEEEEHIGSIVRAATGFVIRGGQAISNAIWEHREKVVVAAALVGVGTVSRIDLAWRSYNYYRYNIFQRR